MASQLMLWVAVCTITGPFFFRDQKQQPGSSEVSLQDYWFSSWHGMFIDQDSSTESPEEINHFKSFCGMCERWKCNHQDTNLRGSRRTGSFVFPSTLHYNCNWTMYHLQLIIAGHISTALQVHTLYPHSPKALQHNCVQTRHKSYMH